MSTIHCEMCGAFCLIFKVMKTVKPNLGDKIPQRKRRTKAEKESQENKK